MSPEYSRLRDQIYGSYESTYSLHKRSTGFADLFATFRSWNAGTFRGSET